MSEFNWKLIENDEDEVQQEEDDFLFDTPSTLPAADEVPISEDREDKLRKDDLYEPQNISRIRAYMAQRHGSDTLDLDDKDLVEGFVDSMRYFNTNVASTGREARYIYNANDQERQIAGEAYQLYDRLGNVFVNDGIMGAVDGVKDYILAAATDPTNYLGLITGGVGKATALGISQAGKTAVKEAAKLAGENAVKQGLNKKAQGKAVEKAIVDTLEQIGKRTIRDPAKKSLLRNAAKREEELFELTLRKQGEKKYKEGLIKRGTKQSLLATAGLDATAAMVQDVMLQNTLMDAGAQEQYSATQTAFSSLLGGVGAGVQLGAMALRGKSGLKGIEEDVDVGKARRASEAETASEIFKATDIKLDESEAEKAVGILKKTSVSWANKVKRGQKGYEDAPTIVDFIKTSMFGADGKSGVMKIYSERGKKVPSNVLVSDVLTNLVQYMSREELDAINKNLASSGIRLGDATEDATNLRDLLSYQISNAGKTLNVMSQLRKTMDAGIVHGQKIIEEQTAETIEKVGNPKYGQYAQSLWRRMLVSSPATSAVNLMGFAQYFGTTAIADTLTYGGLYASALTKPKAARDAQMRQASVYKDMITQKLRYLADPFTTKQAYMKILEENDKVRKTLYDSLTGGVDMSAERYGISKSNKFFRNTEAAADGAAMIAGVRAQDTITKSLMFMSEMDKQVRLKHGKSVEDIMRSGEMDLIDEEVMGLTMDATLKSVFSKDYTKGQNEFVENAATIVESISRAPLIGTILPFGRFFNNVLATAHQMGPTGLVMEGMKAFRKDKNLTDVEALSKATTGTAFLTMAVAYDEERQKDDLSMFQVKAGNTIINAQNTFPMSLFLAAGRMVNDSRKGRGVTTEQAAATLEQLAVGQLASDVEFGRGLTAMVVQIMEADEGQGQIMMDNAFKKAGNIAAGFTRPVDFANKMVGMVANNDAAKDVRQETGFSVATMSSTKYVDNILEAILGEIEGVTGDTLRVATREGDLRDPDPFMSALGVKLVEGRTRGEQLMDSLDLPRYKANKRTEIAAYDRAYNDIIAPHFNKRASKILVDPAFQKLSKRDQRAVWKNEFNDVAKDIKDYMENNAPAPTRLLSMQRKASAQPKTAKKAALDYMRREFGFSGSIRDMTYPELQAYFDYVDFYKTKTNWSR